MIASVVAFCYIQIRGQSVGSPGTNLIWKFVQLSVLSVLASPFGYASLKYIDYPTMILGKSCKLVPVMVCCPVHEWSRSNEFETGHEFHSV